MIPGAEASKAAIMITDGPAGPAEFTRNSENSSASALESMVSMTGYWNDYKLDIPMQSPMAMAMAMMSSAWKPPSMPPSQDDAHTMIGDFTEITVSNSDDDLPLEQATSATFVGRMPDIPEMEMWRTVSLWMFLLSLLFSLLLYLFGSRPSPNGVGTGFLPPPEICQVEVEFPRAPDPPNGYHTGLIGCGTYGFVRLHTLNGCLIVSFPTFVRVYAAQGVCT